MVGGCSLGNIPWRTSWPSLQIVNKTTGGLEISLFEDLDIEGLKLFNPKKHEDARGFFCETYNAATWRDAGLEYNFVQDNHSLSRDVGTVRGLHFQTPPLAQEKLVRVLRGSILDVAVDLRRSSPTYRKYVAVELSLKNWRQLFIPIGFAHGFVTLEPDTEVFYKVTNFYSPMHDRGVIWDDPELAIDWPVSHLEAKLSHKDQKLPFLRDLGEVFS